MIIITRESERQYIRRFTNAIVDTTENISPVIIADIPDTVDICSFVEHFHSSGDYVFLVCDVDVRNFMRRHEITVLYYPPLTESYGSYLDVALKILTNGFSGAMNASAASTASTALMSCPAIPDIRSMQKICIGTHDVRVRRSAGILPILCANGRLYMMLGLDSRLGKYSDFGGRFDERYRPTAHKGMDAYKNNVLADYQIRDGFIDPDILAEHFTQLSTDGQENFLKNALAIRGTDTVSATGGSSSRTPSPRSLRNALGHSDINTAYTAFRELVEETSSRDNRNHKTNRMFALDTLHTKLFKKYQYIYLGDEAFDYDTFVVFFTLDDFNTRNRKGLEAQLAFVDRPDYLEELLHPYSYKKYDQNRANGQYFSKHFPNNRYRDGMPHNHHNDNAYYRAQDVGHMIYGNSEMRRIDLVPLQPVLAAMDGIEYADYMCAKKSAESGYEESGRGAILRSFSHAREYKAPIYDRFRDSFATALVRHHNALETVNYMFDTLRPILIGPESRPRESATSDRVCKYD